VVYYCEGNKIEIATPMNQITFGTFLHLEKMFLPLQPQLRWWM